MMFPLICIISWCDVFFLIMARWWSLTVLEINFRFTPELGRMDLKDSGNDHETSALRDEVCHLMKMVSGWLLK